ncbi:sensor histidine kinase [Aquimarina sp. BL5]|uniref:sensor histidine kinase n=1 Tax=Aquimarina sp. BL5 TaxID=1714860 RepID=UPI000E497D49|nr:HAMP domain-containing sensor histidine kinase [Aquimarina sp. BL5]AXT49299.1 sensor histidine kinase [Aquimarina sp. BL5]RKN04038.1 sensor histidine kinase [Aquimarina sp. BL5]
MKQKVNTLIITSIIALIALCGIQAYLVYNTYQLKKDAFIRETKKAISNIDNTKEMDSLAETWYTYLSENLVEYKKNNILKKEALNRFKPITDSLNHLFVLYYKKEIANRNLEYDIQYKKDIKSIVIYEEEELDTIFSTIDGENVYSFGEKFPKEDEVVMSKARWFTDLDYENEINGGSINVSLDIEVRTVDYINIIGWKRIVFKQMAMLFVFSVLLFLFVVSLFFYSIRNLIRQKKLADIKTDFINNITHELKTPLATLGIASKSLRKEEIQNSSDAFANTLDILDRQNSRLQKLVDQVVTNSLGSEEIVINKEEILDDVYFQNVLKDFELSVQNKNVSIVSKIEFREVHLSIDKFMFTTAILNVLDNAVKYGKENTEIIFRTYLKDDQYEISIHDNGIGIHEKEQRKIFEKFYRVSKGDVHDVKGLGLGLFYTSQIVKAHQGTISLESKPDLGTTFIITLPITE